MKKHEEPTPACTQCGMHVAPMEYHPYAACLMHLACHDAETVTANLTAVLFEGMKRWKAFMEEGIEV